MKRAILFPFILFGLLAFPTHTVDADREQFQQSQSSYLLIDLDTGNVLDERDADKPRPIASLTKLMTAVVALDTAAPDDVLIIPSLIEGIEPTIMGLSTGEELTVEELLYGLLLLSGNDAAEAFATNLGDRDTFVAAMNNKAETLGMTQTRFRTPTGFDVPKQYSSAKDLVMLTQTILKDYPLVEKVIGTYRYQLPETNTHKAFRLTNGNVFLDPRRTNPQWRIWLGKIGNTPEANECIVLVATINDRRVLFVLLGSEDREREIVELLNRAATKI